MKMRNELYYTTIFIVTEKVYLYNLYLKNWKNKHCNIILSDITKLTRESEKVHFSREGGKHF